MQAGMFEGIRLSTQQERLWRFHTQGYAYRAQLGLRIEGGLSGEAMRKAIGRVAQNHEILRTAFHQVPGMNYPLQVISDVSEFVWREVDLTRFLKSKRQRELKRLFEHEARAAFDYERGAAL